ncbi:MAG: hypothetical protein IJ086_10520 [Clostridium sp.]|nr:hypothetical protein [Clostridium sp.]
MNREEFLINYWRYYNILEEDFIKLTRCVRICETNYKTCSDEIIKQFLSVTSEFENICKEVCEFKDSDEHKNINDICNKIFNKIENIQSVEIIVKHTNDLRIKPFKEWNKSKPWELFWWKGYNEVKHNRLEKYESGNLRNLLNSLAALYFMELYLVREIGIKTEDIDVPNSISRLFEVVDFKTKDTVIGYEQYSMTDGDVAEIIDGLKL